MPAAYPFETPVLVLKQPLGDFYLTCIPAEVLLDVSYSHRLKAVLNKSGAYDVVGSQRNRFEERLKVVGKFLNTDEAALPNAIILAANYLPDSDVLTEKKGLAWDLRLTNSGTRGVLTIPSPEKLAAIIDGQHRLFGFGFARENILKTPLVCAIYFDLPKPYQAYLFATINSNQKPVSKSQTYELFGYNVEDEPEKAWTPDKLAVFLVRKLNLNPKSPFHKHILIAAENDITRSISVAKKTGFWMVSTATVVEGILRLITGNAKEDGYVMKDTIWKSRSRSSLKIIGNSPPLRQEYINGNDTLIYTIVFNFFDAAKEVLWAREDNGFIQRNVGVQALFDILKRLLPQALKQKDISKAYFTGLLRPASTIDFHGIFFHASGQGRTRIRNSLSLALGLITLDKITEDQGRMEYQAIVPHHQS